eukprot:CAMPEP_0180651220 /NCGR_PEP_ID=MMETSP1037_2-20121125/52731_1 /TAXON_ID=632150 /ORGANISM="Azadinium spinosum, Strain 3D9" /LENGTH=64 /DNA_ID=CAMNT_0022676779 /DNA_START=114 /DNA_END=308 /DNA_ORIENTATION=+
MSSASHLVTKMLRSMRKRLTRFWRADTIHVSPASTALASSNDSIPSASLQRVKPKSPESTTSSE